MKIGNEYRLRENGLKPGDVVWACAFKVTYDKDDMRFIQKPIMGILSSAKTEKLHSELLEFGKDNISYFIPFKKNKNELAWSKAVQTSARIFATTEEECKEMYNEEVQYYINNYKRKIESLEKELLN